MRTEHGGSRERVPADPGSSYMEDRDYMTSGSLLTPETVGWQLIHYQQRGLPPAPTTEPFTLEQHLADLLTVLDSVGIARVILIGHSWGASLGLFAAMEWARRAMGEPGR